MPRRKPEPVEVHEPGTEIGADVAPVEPEVAPEVAPEEPVRTWTTPSGGVVVSYH